jgi:hypothetical protein
VSPRGAALVAAVAVASLQVAAIRVPLDPSVRRWIGDRMWLACGCGALLGLAAFLPDRLVGVGPLVLALVIASQLALAYAVRTQVRLTSWRVPLFDLVVVLAIALIATDVEFTPITDNDNLFIGAINDILHGRAMLVGAYSQYGVGDMYALAPVFKVVPLGYGTFEFLNGALWVLLFCGIYAILRAARVSRLLAVLAVALIILSSVFAVIAVFATYVGFPSTGPLRFGPAFPVVLAMVVGARRANPVVAHSIAVAVVGLSAVWSFEAFIYTGATFLAAAGADSVLRDDARRRFTRLVIGGAAACVIVHAALAILTRIFAGAWPDWAGYLEFIRLYSSKGFGQLPVLAWSIGIPLGFFYVASAAAIVALVVWHRDLAREQRERFVALAALTGLSIIAYTYFLGRSHVNNLHHVVPAAIALGAVWAAFVSGTEAVGRQTRQVVLALAFGASSLMLVENVPDFLTTWQRTAFAHAVPVIGHGSLRDSVRARWDNPPADGRAPLAESLLASELPGERQTVMLISPNLTVEVLFQTGRINALPISDPVDSDLVPGAKRRVLAAIDRLPLGTGVLLQIDASGKPDPQQIYPLEQAALRALRQRFTLKRIRTEPPFVVLRLVAKR